MYAITIVRALVTKRAGINYRDYQCCRAMLETLLPTLFSPCRYKKDDIRDTPQDCPIVPMATLETAMTKDSSMDLMMSNTMPADVTLAKMIKPSDMPLEVPPVTPVPSPKEEPGATSKPLALGGGRNPFESLKDLAKLFQE